MISVSVVDYGRKKLMLRWRDPVTGQVKSKTATTANRKLALREAQALEAELASTPPEAMTWDQFAEIYAVEHLGGLAKGTRVRYCTTLGFLGTVCGIRRPSDITTTTLDLYVSKMREKESRDSTISSHLSQIRSILHWANDRGIIRVVPKIPRLKRSRSTSAQAPHKGRPITDDEFERILAHIPSVFDGDATGLVGLCRGLYVGGLRLGEAIGLSWDNHTSLSVCRNPDGMLYLRIPHGVDKRGTEQILPITPDFQDMLEAIEPKTGLVFPIRKRKPGNGVGFFDNRFVSSIHFLSRKICAAGEAADVVVSHSPVKYASAHDFRRSFGERWAWTPGITPQILMKLMRHETIETTMRYYALGNAETIAKSVRNVVGNKAGNSKSSETPNSCHKPFDGIG
jgi:integrase